MEIIPPEIITPEHLTPSKSTIIPTIDLSPFTLPNGDESDKKHVMDLIYEACTNFGAFFISNHGMPVDKCEKLLDMNDTFFSYSQQVKKMSTEVDKAMSGSGYNKMDDKYHDYEYLLMHSPGIPYNGVPTIQPVDNIRNKIHNYDYRKTFEEVFISFVKTAKLLEEIINDCLGLPPNFLSTYNDERSWDYMIPMYYTQENKQKYHTRGNKPTEIGIDQHEDPNFITITIQNKVNGLQLREEKNTGYNANGLKLPEDKNQHYNFNALKIHEDPWIPAFPTTLEMLVVVSDLAQVLSNKIIKNATHRALKNERSSRLAIDFCYNFGPKKWIEPVRLLTEEIGIEPKYRGFVYQDYIKMIVNDYKNPPPTVEDFINLTYYEI